MRWMRDVVAAIGLVGVVGGALYVQRVHREEEAIFQRAQSDVHRLELEIKYRAATKTTELNGRGWPVTIDPSWFQDDPPANPLLDDDRPWVEVAGTQQAELLHPPVRMAVDKNLAAFWYNPYQGIVRARVPVMVSDEQATSLYNRVNGVGMASIFIREPAADRPVKHESPKPADGQQQAAGQKDDKPVATFTVRRTDRPRSKH